ncbi:MAG: hypothetical protein IT257_02915, partial [Chitinophagaceae bacterium]|nr:hypothetical protein [Chitinophagaceae bacterium]
EQDKLKEHAQQLIAEKEEVLSLKQKELKRIIDETEKEEKDLLVNRQKSADAVEPRLLLAYSKIRSNFRNGLAVVPVERDSCGGCFNVVPPQRQSEIRLRKKMIICEHCGRIIVDSELVDNITI